MITYSNIAGGGEGSNWGPQVGLGLAGSLEEIIGL